MTSQRRPQDRQRLTEDAQPPRAPRLAINEVLGDAWLLYTRFIGRFFGLAAIVFGVLALVQLIIDSSGNPGLLIISFVVSVVGIFWLQGALVIAVDDARGRKPKLSLGEIFRRVEPVLWTLIAAGLLVAIGVAIGLLLLIIPGLIVLTYLSMITPAIVLESRGMNEAFRRSIDLVSGDGLRVFIAITVILAAIFAVTIRAILSPLPDLVGVYVATVVANSISVPFVALSWTVMYFELRLNKDQSGGG
ncbi:MAG: hypothetical protein ACE5EV_06285 [Gaiellales bacterium]